MNKGFPEIIQILSLPRSGSTLLTRQLSRHSDILCLPESSFPNLLDHLKPGEWKDKDKIAKLFIESCYDGSPLSFNETRDCVSSDAKTTLENVGRAVANKEERDYDSLIAVVWKTTRLVGSTKTLRAMKARFIILHRDPLNVFESQHRVPFGVKNRNSVRFALFEGTYGAAFDRLRNYDPFHLDYTNLVAQLAELSDWIGSVTSPSDSNRSLLDETAGKRAWHATIGAEFQDKDHLKLVNLPKQKIRLFRVTRRVLRITPTPLSVMRTLVDLREARALRRRAER